MTYPNIHFMTYPSGHPPIMMWISLPTPSLDHFGHNIPGIYGLYHRVSLLVDNKRRHVELVQIVFFSLTRWKSGTSIFCFCAIGSWNAKHIPLRCVQCHKNVRSSDFSSVKKQYLALWFINSLSILGFKWYTFRPLPRGVSEHTFPGKYPSWTSSISPNLIILGILDLMWLSMYLDLQLGPAGLKTCSIE